MIQTEIHTHPTAKSFSGVCSSAAATAFPRATEAALGMLSKGGNAVDAAVAAAWALCVCEPAGSGLGGQTSLLMRLASGELYYLDGHSYAPAAVSLHNVSKTQQSLGFRACTVPSTVATLEKARQRFGRLSREEVLEPAIQLATDGFEITELQRHQARWRLRGVALQKRRPRVLRAEYWQTEARLQQPRLARTLRRLARHGAHTFYRGRLAARIVADMQANGGLIRAKDLAAAHLPVERQPVSISYRGYEVVSTPPPGGGLQLLLALKLLERLLPTGGDWSRTDWYVATAQAVYAAFEEREKFPIHPDDFTPSVRAWALSDARCAEVADRLAVARALSGIEVDPEEPGETTHLCVADREGNVVSLTQSIQSLFGARAANWELGFLYNNYLTTCPRYRHPYQLGSRCLPRSNAAPTLVLEDGQPILALGAAGSRRIISSVLQIVSRVLDWQMPLAEAVTAPRVHALLDGSVWLEKPAATSKLTGRLSQLFERVEIRSKHSFLMGGAQALAFPTKVCHEWQAAADPRRDGSAAGATS